MIKIALCDNSINYLNYIQKALEQLFQQHNTCITITKFMEGNRLLSDIELNKTCYNLIFLEVEINDVSGFEIAKRLLALKYNTKLIFITNNSAQIQEGYKYSAYRYILKKNMHSELIEAVQSYSEITKNLNANVSMIYLKYKHDEMIDYLKCRNEDILYFYKIDRTTFVKTIFGTYQLLQYTLSHYKAMLQNDSFIIVQRSYLLNLYHVKKLIGDYFVLSNKETLCLGYDKHIKDRIQHKYFSYLVNLT